MKTFKLYQEKRVSIWIRNNIEVEAETEQEAINKALNEDCNFGDSEILYETETPIELCNNEGWATIEIYNDKDCIYANGKH